MGTVNEQPIRTSPGATSLSASRDRLAACLAARVTAQGGIRTRYASRTLETALLATLLRDTGLFPSARQQLERYLRDRPAGDLFDQVLAQAALGQLGQRSYAQALEWLDGFDHFTSGRKRVLLTAVLAALGVPGFTAPEPGTVDYQGLAPWVQLSLSAVQALRSPVAGDPAEGEVAFILDRLAHGSSKVVWEGVVSAHVLALTALHRHVPRHPAVSKGVADLLIMQNADGGMPPFDGLDVFGTAIAGLALAKAGGDHRRKLVAMGDYLAVRQREDGGWAYTEGVSQSDSDDTAYCLQLLTAVSPRRYADQIDAGLAYLIDLANPDGGIPTFRRGHPSEITMTAGALTVLSAYRDRYPEACRAAVDFLIAAQQPDGTYERSWSLSESNAIYRTVIALRAAAEHEDPDRRRRIEQAVTTATHRLTRTQHADGGWGQTPDQPSDAISTAYALLALDARLVAARHAGVAYLVTQQRPDGRVLSRPDQVAPRPLPCDIPVLADAFPLWALGDHLSPGAPGRAETHHAGEPLVLPASPPSLDASDVRQWKGGGADVLELLTRVRRLGPVAAVPGNEDRVVLATSADAVQQVLVQRAEHYVRHSSRMRFLLGTGVIPASGESWQRQRRMLQRHFTVRSLARYETATHASVLDIVDRWARSVASGQSRDIAADMRRYSLDVMWRCLTGHPVEEGDYHVLDKVNTIFGMLPAVPQEDPAADPRIATEIAAVHSVIDRAIRDARGPRHTGSPWLLPTLVRTTELTDQEIRDEILTLVVAGYETTAHTLAWVLILLDQHPDELDHVRSAGREGSLARITTLRAVVNETLRLYPVAWLMSRRALTDDIVCGYRVTAGTRVMLSPYLTHRDPELWPEPERFAPQRFTARHGRPTHPGAYYPFGVGPRACLGAHFAQRAMPALLDHLLSRFTPRLHRVPAPVFGLTINLDGPVPATVVTAVTAAGSGPSDREE